LIPSEPGRTDREKISRIDWKGLRHCVQHAASIPIEVLNWVTGIGLATDIADSLLVDDANTVPVAA